MTSDISPPLADVILKQTFGYHYFRSGQRDVIDAAMSGQDCLVVMPTGGGKSLCYQIPALMLEGIALVISPLISLMKDQVDQLAENGVSARFLNATMNGEQQQEVWSALVNGEAKLLYVSPERVQSSNFLRRLQQISLSLIAIDEAHCISQWGHDFRPEYAQIGLLKRYFPQTPMIALTATADQATRDDICQKLALRSPLVYLGSFDRPNIRYLIAEKHKPLTQLFEFIRTKTNQSGIIYCNSRKRVEMIASQLAKKHYRVDFYHAGLEHAQRNAVHDAFLRDDIQIVVATVAFGMGINKPNVRFVVHFDVPRNIESYYQETGRAGRDGLPSKSMLLYDPKDMGWLKSLLVEKDEGDQKRIESDKLQAMEAFAETLTCRRLVLLNYFGEYRKEPCGNCDICLDPPVLFNATELAQKALSCVYRTQQSHGINYTIDVLIGSQKRQVLENQHDQISTYGLGKEYNQAFWVSIFRQLIHRGLLVQNIARFSSLQLTENARPVLRGELELSLAVPRLEIGNKGSTKANPQASTYYDKNLVARLKKLRKRLADEYDIPPSYIFSDATLMEISAKMPTTKSDLLKINGVGQVKLAKYGDDFLRLIEQQLLKS